MRTAFRGEAGLQECARFQPELVLCDIRMPDLSGYEVARRLRAHPNGLKPVIVGAALRTLTLKLAVPPPGPSFVMRPAKVPGVDGVTLNTM